MPIDEVLEDPNRDEDIVNPDKRRPMRLLDSLVQRDDELSDSEDEGEGGRKNHARHRDPDSVVSPSGRRFGVGVGIMGSAPPGVGSAAAAVAGGVPIGAATGGSGGPSAHTAIEALVHRKTVPVSDSDVAMEEESAPADNDQMMIDAEDNAGSSRTTPARDMEISEESPATAGSGSGDGSEGSQANGSATKAAESETK